MFNQNDKVFFTGFNQNSEHIFAIGKYLQAIGLDGLNTLQDSCKVLSKKRIYTVASCFIYYTNKTTHFYGIFLEEIKLSNKKSTWFPIFLFKGKNDFRNEKINNLLK